MNKNNIFFKKMSEKESLEYSLKANDEALDYIQNEILRIENLYKLTSSESDLSDLNCCKYIEISLKHLGKCYKYKYKKLGFRLNG